MNGIQLTYMRNYTPIATCASATVVPRKGDTVLMCGSRYIVTEVCWVVDFETSAIIHLKEETC